MVKEDDCILNRQSLLTVRQSSHGYQKRFTFAYLFGIFVDYYMAMSQKDWKQTNSRIWSAKIDLDRGLDFPI